MDVRWTIETHRDREAMMFEEVGVFFVDQSAVCGDRKPDLLASCACFLRRVGRCLSQYGSVDQRLATQEGEIDAFVRPGLTDEQIDGRHGGFERHVLRSRSE